MTVEYRAIRMTELDECLDLWDRAFAHTPIEYFAPYFHNDPCFTPEYTRVCKVDGRLVSAVQICERRIRVGNVSLLMGGIGNVGTDPVFRGQGHSTRLIEDSIGAMESARMDFSLLYTGINPFYERLGWRGIPNSFYTGRLKESLNDTQYESLRPCNWDEDIDAIISIYDEFNKSRSGTAIRTRKYWMQWVKARSGNGSSFLIADDEDGISGYIQCNYDAENIWLREIGYRPDDYLTAERLINAAISEAHVKGVRTLWSHLPDESEILDILFRNTESIEKRYSSGGMYRIINIESMLNRLQLELSDRLISRGVPSCILHIDADGDSHEAFIRGSSPDRPIQINLGWCDFISLMFSLNDTQHITDSEIKPVFEALFPISHTVSWSLDHF